jgi:hypothetical protein
MPVDESTVDSISPDEVLQRVIAASHYKIATPVIAVVDTSFLYTGLQAHLARGHPPRSLTLMRSNLVHAFMEGETLREMFRKIPEFAEQFHISGDALADLFIREWLPSINIVDLPDELKDLDTRSLVVRQRDQNDYAAASLAALLSPCILLTHDLDFDALGVKNREQALFAICLIEDVSDGDAAVKAALMIPGVPLIAVGVGAKHAYDRFGPVAIGVVGLIVAGGILLYFKQPPDRRNAIKGGTGKVFRALAEMHGEAVATAEQVRRELRQNLVPPALDPPPFVTIFRTLATTPTSLSAQQLHVELETKYIFDVRELRAYLHGNKDCLFFEERRGGFRLGLPYYRWSEMNGTWKASASN